MEDRWDVVVVGAGITGLAAAFELTARGNRVLVVERTAVAAEQSAGIGRIFRVTHGDPRLCSLAMEAAHGWRRWEDALGAGRLLGSEGLVSAGPLVESQMDAMETAGADVRAIGRDDVRRLVPHLAAQVEWEHALFDPAAGSLRIRRAQNVLAVTLNIVVADVVAIADAAVGERTAQVRLSTGETLRAGHVLVCAGTATGPLVAPVGIDLGLEWSHHVRLTYTASGGGPIAPSAALILDSAYGLPLGSTGRWGLGLHDPGPPAPIDSFDADVYAGEVRRQHAAWLPHNMPALDPNPVDEIRCVSLDAPFLDARGDGFIAVRGAGRIIACTGSNMMKFGPVLGDRLARTVLDPDCGVHDSLAIPVRADDVR